MVSIIIKIILYGYFFMQANKMLKNEMDTLGLNQSLTVYDDVGRISLKEAGMIPFFRLLDGSTYVPKSYDPDLYGKYVNLAGFHYGKKDGKDEFKMDYKMRLCKKSDFEGAEIYFERAEKLKKNSLICLDDYSKIYIEGNKDDHSKDY